MVGKPGTRRSDSYSRHAAAVIGVAFAIVGDHGLAEDVAQETFSRAWRAGATYDPRRGGVHSWLLAISRNAAIDHVRVGRARPLDPEAVTALLADNPEGRTGLGRMRATLEVDDRRG